MSNLKIPVPAGFTISTEICKEYYEHQGSHSDEVVKQVKEGVAHIEKIMGAKFGDPDNPLLLSVRSGAPASMPGMMDTVLNLGLNDTTIKGIINQSGNERFGWDSYRRFVQMYGDVVMGLKPESKEEEDPFEVIIDEMKERRTSQYVGPHSLARVYTSLGEIDQAFEWLDKAYEEKDAQVPFFLADPVSTPLRDDPRFEELLRKINLPEDVIQKHLARRFD